jgi:hypothetical protein
MGFFRCRRSRTANWLLATLAVVWVLAASVPACGQDLYRIASDLRAKCAAEVEQLAKWCDEQSLPEQAKKTRALLGQQTPYKFSLPVLPREIGSPPLPDDASPEMFEWNTRLTKMRREQATALFDLARRAIRSHRASLAYDLVLLTSRANPDHEGARRVLGYQKYRNEWHTPYEIRKLRANMVWNDKFGWLVKSSVRKYEQGQRPSGNRWITAEEDARLHKDIRSGWEIESEHYSIRTDHSIESAVALGVKLDSLNRLWQQMFVRYYASEAHVAGLFDTRAQIQRPDPPLLNVVYFRDEDDYVRSLQGVLPGVDKSLGVYVEKTHTAYFFGNNKYGDRTTYHEATHQLFQQSRRVSPEVGRKANFWICEGIAMFMETLHEEDGCYVLGGLDDVRLKAARYHLVKGDYFVPFGQLTRYGMERIQQDPKIAALYSQMAAMANFLVFYDNGRYRDALVDYLIAVYTGRDTPATLAELTGTGYAELDKQYKEYMGIEAE